MDYIIYYFTHDRHGYSHTEYLCFICATKEAISCRDHETIHAITTKEGEGRKRCTICSRKLNWIDT